MVRAAGSRSSVDRTGRKPRGVAASTALLLLLTVAAVEIAQIAVAPKARAVDPPPAVTQVVAGTYFSCGVGSGGVQCWGLNAYGSFGNGTSTDSPEPVPVSLPVGKTIGQLDAGAYHVCAVATDGTAWCWGGSTSSPNAGQLGNGDTANSTTPVAVTMPVGKTFTTIATGDTHSCAIANDGNAWCWGSGYGSSPVAITMPAGRTFTKIALGYNHSCAIANDGNAWCWGSDSVGQLGNGAASGSSDPTAVSMPGGRAFSAIAAGSEFTCAVATDGTAWCWGYNELGRLGDGTQTTREVPTQVVLPAGRTFARVSAGANHACALADNGAGYCWGGNSQGQLGIGTQSDSFVPAAVAMPVGVAFSDISAGTYDSCALASDGSSWCWGYNYFGQVGDGTRGSLTPKTSPTKVISRLIVAKVGTRAGIVTSGASEINCGTTCTATFPYGSSVTLSASAPGGTTFSGWSGEGCTGNATCSVTMTGARFVTAAYGPTIASGSGHSCLLKADGTAWCWGTRSNASSSYDASPTAVTMPVGTAFSQIAPRGQQDNSSAPSPGAGSINLREFTCSLTAGGAAWCWGYNGQGQLGDGTSSSSSSPGAVTMPPGQVFTSIATGYDHTCAIASDGSAWCWGANGRGQLGDGTTTQRLIPTAVATQGKKFAQIAAGFKHTCAVATDGSAWCWGDQTYGTLGNDVSDAANFQTAPVPVVMPTGKRFTQIAASQYYTCAVATDGTGWCWGNDFSARLGNGATSTDQLIPAAVSMPAGKYFAQIATALSNACALATDGDAWCWGSDGSGALGNGPGGISPQNLPNAVTMPVGRTFVQVAVSQLSGCAQASDGTFWCWGRNSNGSVGDGTTTNRDAPVLVGYLLSVTKSGTGSGTVTSSNVSGVDCGSTCAYTYDYNTSVTLSASAGAGSVFTGWSGEGCSGTGTCVVSMTQARSVTAAFSPDTLTLGVSKSGAGSGTVTSTSSPSQASQINCGATCSASFGYNTSVTLSASAGAGSVFTGWSGEGCSGTGTCVVSMTQARSVTAAFGLVPTLTVTGAGIGQGTITATGVSCSWNGSGSSGDCTEQPAGSVTLTATAQSGYTFKDWLNCDSTSGTQCTVSVAGGSKTVTARFGYTLTVAGSGAGSGTITSSNGSSGINCSWNGTSNSGDCSEIIISQSPYYVTWNGLANSYSANYSATGCDGFSGTNECYMNQLHASSTVTVPFLLRPVLTVAGAGTGNGSVTDESALTCTSTAGTTSGTCTALGPSSRTLTAQSVASGSTFVSWSGCDSTQFDNICNVAWSANKTVTVTFAALHTLTLAGTGSGGGTFSTSPVTTNCQYLSGTGTWGNCAAGDYRTITVTANPSAGSGVAGWSNCDSSDGNTCTVSLANADRTVTANFGLLRTLTVTPAGSGTGTITGLGIDCAWDGASVGASDCSEVRTGDAVLTAVGTNGAGFVSWSGCDSLNANQCTVSLASANRTVIPTFGKNLTVAATGGGSGSVTASNGLDCAWSGSGSPTGVCTKAVSGSITLTATAADGSAFATWTGCDSSVANQCTVSVTSLDRTVTAWFGHSVSVTWSGTGTGGGTITASNTTCTWNGTGTPAPCSFAATQSVTLSASPAATSAFAGWTGCDSNPTATTCAVNLASSNRSVTANFVPRANISGLSAISGGPGTSFLINGTNFYSPASCSVNSIAWLCTVLSSTQIVIAVPSGATSGPVAVSVYGAQATVTSGVSTTFTVGRAVAPTLSATAPFSPTAGVAGTVITITGTNLAGATSVKVGTVTLTLASTPKWTVLGVGTLSVAIPQGAASGTVAVTTGGGTVTSAASLAVNAPDQITSLTATRGNAQVALSWSAPANNGLAISSYEVRYSTSVAMTSPTTVTAIATTSYTRTGLTNGTTYYFQVRALNSGGGGVWGPTTPTSAKPATLPSAPAAPTLFRSDFGKITATTTGVTGAATGGETITGYTFTATSATVGATTPVTCTISTPLPSPLSCQLTLTPGASYTVRVKATNVVGTGLDSAASATLVPVSRTAFSSNATALATTTTLTLTPNSGSTVPVGARLLVYYAADTTAATAPTVSSVAFLLNGSTTGAGAATCTTNYGAFAPAAGATAGSGIRGGIIYCNVTTQLAANAVMRITLSAAPLSAIAMGEYLIGFATGGTVTTVTATVGVATAPASGTSASLAAGRLVVGAFSYEYDSSLVLAADADTNGGTWSTSTGLSSSGLTLAGLSVFRQLKWVTTAATQQFNSTTLTPASSDWVAALLSIA